MLPIFIIVHLHWGLRAYAAHFHKSSLALGLTRLCCPYSLLFSCFGAYTPMLPKVIIVQFYRGLHAYAAHILIDHFYWGLRAYAAHIYCMTKLQSSPRSLIWGFRAHDTHVFITKS